MNTIECITTRRSIRKFRQEKVSHELLEKIISAASYAPSWKNTQIVRYIAIENDSLKSKISSDYLPSYNSLSTDSAPLLIAVTIVKNRCGFERDGSYSTPKKGGWQMFDAGIAAQTLCLAAHEFGLGTVIMGIFEEDGISSILNLPHDRELTALIALGYPDISPDPPKRRQTDELLTYK